MTFNSSTGGPRTTQLLDWLSAFAPRYQLDLTSLAPASSDAGTRCYFRLASQSEYGSSLIAVDAPPPEKNREFVHIASLFTEAGVHVPHILESDVEHGFMLITDLGGALYLNELKAMPDPAQAQPLFEDALATLIRWQSATRANVLPLYSEALLRRELELFTTWYIERHLGFSLDDTSRAALESVFTKLIERALAQPQVFVHRDYMPRNLMLCPSHNPGVLDFQDAVLGPITYDVVSLFRDAFISWEPDFELACVKSYWAQAQAAHLPVGNDFAQFYQDFEWMGLQRHLKVLGIFARLHYRDGKPHYLQDAPRFLAYLRSAITRYPELTPLAHVLDKLDAHAARASVNSSAVLP